MELFKVGQSDVEALKSNFGAEPSEEVPDTTNLEFVNISALQGVSPSSLLDQLDWPCYRLLGAVQILCGGASNLLYYCWQ